MRAPRCQFDPDAPPPDSHTARAGARGRQRLLDRGAGSRRDVEREHDAGRRRGVGPCTAGPGTLRSALGVATSNAHDRDRHDRAPAGMYALSAQLPGLNVPTSQTGIEIRGAGANTRRSRPPRRAGADGRHQRRRDAERPSHSSGGEVTSGTGGNLSVAGAAAVTLVRVRVTGGTAQQGGGIAASGVGTATSLTIRQSLIDGNNASGAAMTAAGGGLYIFGATSPVTVTVTDTTIAGNFARQRRGRGDRNNATAPPTSRVSRSPATSPGQAPVARASAESSPAARA